ncbi:MlaD family protein [Veillonella sp.]|jgi:phospholipid/cholesterol/gamma-HCH transport system substrate-binding protein|uniref:MlaD family protein n=1 Tax=Veillonella sp. TaxID=1926307 RepID=UPI001B5D0271|nr:MlaD family protein [Veillonella sp.]MBP9550618.1 MCE family protein [Veillonella sp.]
MKWTTEAKVGAFTILGLILFVSSIVFVGKMDIFAKPEMAITGQFEQVNGLKTGNQVKLSGVAVGTVDSVEIVPGGVAVGMKINEGTEIPSDSKFMMGADGLLGDKFIQISPGKSKVYLHDGDSVRGEGADSMDKAMQSAQKLMEGTEKMLESINNIIGDPQTQGALRHTLQSTSVMADNAVAITQNMADMTAQLNAATQQFNADGQAGADMRGIVTNLKETTDKVDNMARAMGGVVTDPTAAENIKETLHNTAQISARINKIVGGKAYVSSTTSSNGNGGTATTEGQDSEKKSQLSTETSADLLYNNHQDEYRVNARFRLFTNKTLGELGFSNIGDGTDFDLNGGKYIADKWSIRAGLFESELGFSLDYGLGGPFSISAAMYDLNHQKYRIRSEFRLAQDTYGILQMTRPFGSDNGGTYFGIKQVF